MWDDRDPCHASSLAHPQVCGHYVYTPRSESGHTTATWTADGALDGGAVEEKGVGGARDREMEGRRGGRPTTADGFFPNVVRDFACRRLEHQTPTAQNIANALSAHTSRSSKSKRW